MSSLAAVYLGVLGVWLLFASRRSVAIPFLGIAFLLTPSLRVDLGPFSFTAVRILVFLTCIRAAVKGEFRSMRWTTMEKWMVAFVAWAAFSSVFHKDVADALVYRLGLCINFAGVYFSVRVLFRTRDEIEGFLKALALMLVGVALSMSVEQLIRQNPLAVLGGVPWAGLERAGRFRSQGPFAHAILAGTVGGTCVASCLALYPRNRLLSVLGVCGGTIMALASASSGAIMALFVAVVSIAVWRWRAYMHVAKIAAVALYVVLEIVMNRPAYFVITQFNITGSSTGWHRAELIRSSIEHFGEWWLGGTDYTRHWMATGVNFSPDHADITNHYLGYGVHGGMPLLILLVLIIRTGLRMAGDVARNSAFDDGRDWVAWALGCALFGHAVAFISVAYFDQSLVMPVSTLALLASLHTETMEVEEAHLHAANGDEDPGSMASAWAATSGHGAKGEAEVVVTGA